MTELCCCHDERDLPPGQDFPHLESCLRYEKYFLSFDGVMGLFFRDSVCSVWSHDVKISPNGSKTKVVFVPYQIKI